MQIYLVGGAIRDQLLGLPVTERDWVVVGATPEQMLSLGYKAVGKDFPVFLHPQTHEEYALARTERKVAKGYKGFQFYCAPEVTLEQDLARRDLTINAIAQDHNDHLIDPYHGQRDLKQRRFQHVSPAFAEDPVRILRLARFAARFPDFTVAAETQQLMQQMVKQGEVDALVPERVWQELARALAYQQPTRFFKVLADSHALAALWPEIKLTGQGMQALARASEQTPSPDIRFSCLLHDLAPDAARALCKTLRAPNHFAEPALLMTHYYHDFLELDNSQAKPILRLLQSLDSRRRPQRLQHFLQASAICSTQPLTAKIRVINQAWQAISTVNTDRLQQQGLAGRDFAAALQQRQLEAISNIL